MGVTNIQTIKRLKSLETMHSGAQLAELDLSIRGSGDLFGSKQHGVPKLRVASFSDFSLIDLAKKEAIKIFPKIHACPMLLVKLGDEIGQNVSPD